MMKTAQRNGKPSFAQQVLRCRSYHHHSCSSFNSVSIAQHSFLEPRRFRFRSDTHLNCNPLCSSFTMLCVTNRREAGAGVVMVGPTPEELLCEDRLIRTHSDACNKVPTECGGARELSLGIDTNTHTHTKPLLSSKRTTTEFTTPPTLLCFQHRPTPRVQHLPCRVWSPSSRGRLS
eukprot:1180755-Prorocentrum_minimum.AAC.5